MVTKGGCLRHVLVARTKYSILNTQYPQLKGGEFSSWVLEDSVHICLAPGQEGESGRALEEESCSPHGDQEGGRGGRNQPAWRYIPQ